MATIRNDHFNYNQITANRLIVPISKSIILVLVISSSTGVFIRKLFWLALTDIVSIFVALLWVIGDVIPCIAFLNLIHDSLTTTISHHSINLCRLLFPRSILSTILSLFTLLYLIDLALLVLCHYSLSEKEGIKYALLQSNYQKAFFNIQVLLSILYLAKPWQWKYFDLRQIVAKMERFYLLAYKMAQSISERLESASNDSRRQSYGNLPLNQQITGPLETLEMPRDPPSNRLEECSNEPILTAAHPIAPQPAETTHRIEYPSSVVRKTATRVQKAVKSVAVQRRGRERNSVDVTTRSARSRSSRNRTTRSNDIRIRSASTQSRSRKSTLKVHKCISISDGTRTVNLNLNMS